MAGEWDVIDQKPIARAPAPAGGGWNVVQQTPLQTAPGTAPAPRDVGFGEGALRGLAATWAAMNQKAGVALTTLPAMGIQAAKNYVTGEDDTSITDWQRGKFVAPWERSAQENAIQPGENLTGTGIAGNILGNVVGQAIEMPLGGPARKGAEAGLSVVQSGLKKLLDQTPSAMNMAATQGFNRTNQLQAQGVPKDVADSTAIASYPTNVAGFALPLTVAAPIVKRALMGGAANLATEIPAIQQENRVLTDLGHAKHVQDLLDPVNSGTSVGIGALLSALMGTKAPRPVMTREQGGYVPGNPSYTPDPARAPDWAMQRYGDVLAANGITDPADPRAISAVERLQQSEARKAAMRPGQGDPNVDNISEAIFAGEAHPNAAPWAGRTADAPPATVRVDSTGNAIPLDATGAPQRPGDVAGFDSLDAARQTQIRDAYIQAGLDPDSQLNALNRRDLPPDLAPDIRSVKAELDDDQKGLVAHYMGVPPEELGALGANAQRTLLAKAMEAQERDTSRADQGPLQTTFTGGDERSSPASRPNVPGDRSNVRSEFEDTNARMAQDQEAADLNALRERAAGGDKKAKAELGQKEAQAKKAAGQKKEMIERLQALRQQRDAMANGAEYVQLKRTRDTGGKLDEKQQKKLASLDAQHSKLGDSIFNLEGRIYDISEKSDLASAAASGSGDRPFRGFSRDEAEHAGMFEQEARQKASKAEQAELDRLEAEWRERQKIFEARARAKAEQEARAKAEQDAKGKAGQERTQRGSESGPKQTGDGTAEAAPIREDGNFGTNEDGFVTSTNGNPVHFGHQRDAGWWILKKGNKQSKNQVFEIANHPSGKGFTVRETHKTDPGSGPKGEPGAGPKEGPKEAPKEKPGAGPKAENESREDAGALPDKTFKNTGEFQENRVNHTRSDDDFTAEIKENGGYEMPLDMVIERGDGALSPWFMKDGTIIGTGGDHVSVTDEFIYSDYMKRTGAIRASFFHDRIEGYVVSLHTPEGAQLSRQQIDVLETINKAYDGKVKFFLGQKNGDVNPEYRKTTLEALGGKTEKASEPKPEPAPEPAPKGPSDKQIAYRAKLRAKALERRIVDAADTMMQAIIKMGGIHESLRMDLTGDAKGNRDIPFVGYLFNKTGTQDLSDLATRLEQHGFFTQADLDSVDGGAQLLRDHLASEYNGFEPHRSNAAGDEDFEAQHEAHERMQQAELLDKARTDAAERGIAWDENKSDSQHIDDYIARQETDFDQLDERLGKALEEAQALLGDRADALITPGNEKDPAWYRDNIEALKNAIEEEHAHRENILSRETDGRGEGEDPDDGSGTRSSEARSQEDEGAGREEGGEGRPEPDEFSLRGQTEAELNARNAEEKEAQAEKEAEQRKAEAAEKKAREDKEIASRQKSSAENFKLGESAEDSLSGQGDLLNGGGKSDAGTLYANPFHKALQWFIGDSRAWAGSLSELSKSIADLRKSASTSVSSNPLVAFARAWLDSSSADIRATIKLNPSKAAQWVVDQFHDQAGSGRATGETYGSALGAKTSKAMVDLHRILGDLVHDDSAMAQIAKMLRSSTPPNQNTKLGKAAAALRKMLDDELKYLRDAGVDLGEVKPGYFPREYVLDKIIKNGQGFIDAATKAYMGTGLNRTDAATAAKELHDTLVYGEHGNIFKSQGGAGQAPFLKGRVFGKEIDNETHPLNQFLNHDVSEVLAQYFQRSAKRAEIARRFGDNFSHWRDYIDEKGKKQEGLLTRIEKEGGQGALPKLQGYIALAAGIRSYGISAGGLRAASIMRTWGALSFLEKATLSSLTEFIVPAMRSGNVLDAGRSLSMTLNDLFIKTKDAQERRAFAEDLGLIAGHIDSALSAARFAGGEPVGKLESKVLDRFFKRTGLTPWTDATRVAATDISRIFIRRLALDAKGKLNTRHFADLGIPADKVEAFSKFVNKHPDGMPGAADLKGEMGDLYRVAVRKFVSQSQMNPSATTKPSWMSHPIGAVVGQLQSFNYAFYENVIKRNVRLARESATGSGYTNIERAKMVAPMMISPLLIATAYAIGEGRDELLGDPNRRKVETDREKWLKAASRGMPIAPLDPVINYFSSAKYQRGAAQSFAGPVAGVAATGFDAARDTFMNNSEKTNTQERAAARATWDIFVEPAINLALFAAPVAPLSAAITQAAGSGQVREKFFVTPLAGAKHEKGDRAFGRTERVSPR
jgi:hypothetical protein